MTDLSYCHLHFTDYKLRTISSPDQIDFIPELQEDDLDIPHEHIPPDPDDADCLPSQIHTSYPYGNPTKLSHPAALGAYPFGLGSGHLASQITYSADPATIAAAARLAHLHWDDLALDELVPSDPRKIEADRSARARRNATGHVQSHGTPSASAPSGVEPGVSNGPPEEAIQTEAPVTGTAGASAPNPIPLPPANVAAGRGDISAEVMSPSDAEEMLVQANPSDGDDSYYTS